MIKNQVYGSSPVTTRYSTFTGGFGMIVSGVGLLSLFVTFIPAIVPIALDTLAGFLFLGGGIVCLPFPFFCHPPCSFLPSPPMSLPRT